MKRYLVMRSATLCVTMLCVAMPYHALPCPALRMICLDIL